MDNSIEHLIKNGLFIAGFGVLENNSEPAGADTIKTLLYGAEVLDDNFSSDRILVQYNEKKYLCKKKDVLNFDNNTLQRNSAYTFIATDNIKLTKYWMDDGKVHRESGPAMIEMAADKITELYFIDGIQAKNLFEYYTLLSKKAGNKQITLSLEDIEKLSGIPEGSLICETLPKL